MFSAYTLYILWRKKQLFRPFVIIIFFFMTFGGVIDFFPIYNDHKISITDYKENEDANWIKNNTSPNSVFLNTTFLYDPASLAGRKIFLGWPYFAWSQGYNTEKRGKILKSILGSEDKQTACKLLEENKIDYLEIKVQNPPDPNVPPIFDLFQKEFVKGYANSQENYSIYSVNSNCNEDTN